MAKWKNSVLYDLLGADKRQQQNYALVYPTLVSEEELRDSYSSDYPMASGRLGEDFVGQEATPLPTHSRLLVPPLSHATSGTTFSVNVS